MTIPNAVRAGALMADAVIDIAADTTDHDVATVRVGVLEFLRVHAARIEAAPDEAELVQAYRDWLDVAVELYSTGEYSLVRDYLRRGALLRAELDLVTVVQVPDDGVPAAVA